MLGGWIADRLLGMERASSLLGTLCDKGHALRQGLRAFIPLFIANAVFWSLFQQIFTVLAVCSDERMNWSIFSWTAPPDWTGSTPRKFAYGVIGMGPAFLLFLPTSGMTGKAVTALLVVVTMAMFPISDG